MSKQNSGEDTHNFELRVYCIQYLILCAFLSLGIRFCQLQVIRHDIYTQQAENNRTREIPIIAPRGAIMDRNGKILVDNTPAFNIVVTPELTPELNGSRDNVNLDETIHVLIEYLGVDRNQLMTELNNPRRPKSQPILVKQNANLADRAWVAAHQYEHPEIEIETQPQRRYVHNKLAAHVLGYIGEISPQQLTEKDYSEAGYKAGDIIGLDGIEKQYDRLLRGKNGVRRVIVDSRGRPIREKSREDPIKGHDIMLTIDIDLQRVAEEQFDQANETGVAIAMDPQNGEILTFVSKPSFDPNVFAANVISSQNKAEVRAIINDPARPLYNKGIRGIYPTGSTWKLMMATAGLETGVITPENSRLLCGGGIQLGSTHVACMGSHGAPDIHTAIVKSCDGYFYRLGLKLGVDRIHEWVKKFGMGTPTGIDLPNEIAGKIPDREEKKKNRRNPIWKDIDTVWASIGQGSVAVPPIQLLNAESGIITGGIYHTPHFLKEARDTQTYQVAYYDDKHIKNLMISPETVDIITYGAWGVVNEGGTASSVGFPRELNIGGKTGTAQVIAKEKVRTKEHRDHSWFISFAPLHTDQKPELSIVVLTENGGFGAKASAPKARMIFAAYYSKKLGRPIDPEMVAKAEVAKGDTELKVSPHDSNNASSLR